MINLYCAVFSLMLISFANSSVSWKHEFRSCDSVINYVIVTDTSKMFSPVPNVLIVTNTVNDSDVIVVRSRCVVQSKYSVSELYEIEKKSKSTDDWKAFYDDYLFYNEDVSMFIYERAMVIIESEKKFIRFLFKSGESITVDRLKSAGKLFFFNPESGIRQCDSKSFDRRKYSDF